MFAEQRLCFFLMAAILAFGGLSCRKSEPVVEDGDSPQEASSVRRAFKSYKKALDASDGKKACLYVSKSSFDMYQQYRDLALRGTRKELEALPLNDRIGVLRCRIKLTKDELEKLDGRGLYALIVDQKWYSVKGTLASRLAKVNFRDGRATAAGAIKGRLISVVDEFGVSHTKVYEFVKEGGTWKVDLAALSKMTDLIITQVLRKAKPKPGEPKITPEMFLKHELSQFAGKEITDDIWKPLAGSASGS